MQIYWGDLHNHCGISYGYGSLENALKNAKTHLDFCCVTGHAMWPDMYEKNSDTAFIVDFHKRGFEKLKRNWSEVQRRINAANCAELVTFQSYEMHSSLFGDHHFVSPDSNFPLIYRNTPGEVVRDCGTRAIAIPHHIGYTPGYRGINWDLYQQEISPVIEVVSKHGCAMRDDGPLAYYHDMGPLDPGNTVAEGLRRGYHFSFVGSTDHHAGFPGSYNDGIAAVWAEGKTREEIWSALLHGHTYACTGDRMSCNFSLNESMMGDIVSASNRLLRLEVQGETPLEMINIRRNGVTIGSFIPEHNFLPKDPEDHYLLRIEMGWGNSPEKYHWDGNICVKGGKILRITPYLRGKNALSPSDKVDGREEDCNFHENGCSFVDSCANFYCDTFCNISTLHPMTSAFLIEICAPLDARVQLKINGIQRECSLLELTEKGYTGHVKPWHSHAYKMHTAYAVANCRAVLEMRDIPHSECDYYQAESIQINGQRAFISPIFCLS